MLSGMICKTFEEREKTKNNEAPLFFFSADKSSGARRKGTSVSKPAVCRKGC